MKIVTDKNKKIEYETAVALGNFDGIHLGHKKLIDTMIEISKKMKIIPSVFTFDCDFNEFKLGNKYNYLFSEKQKELILKDLGVELLYKIKFCQEIKSMTPEEFIKEIIIKQMNAKLIVVGFNFKFGYRAQGDVSVLQELSKKYDFKLEIISPIIKDDNIISSTLIRDYIVSGQINQANKMLGRNYSILGEVIRGKGRGSNLGFATANLKCDANYVSPKYGVYRTTVIYNNKEYKSITNVGSNPTFNDVGFSIESHILDFSKSIYGERIEIIFEDFLREEQKFESIEMLVEQVNNDIEKVKRWN